MASEDLSFAGISTPEELINRSTEGKHLIVFLTRLGFWNGAVAPAQLRSFPVDFSIMRPEEIARASSYWQSELSRLLSIMGAVEGEHYRLQHRAKRARAKSIRSQLLVAAASEAKKVPTQVALNAVADENPEVMDSDDKVVLFKTALLTLGHLKEAYEGNVRALSRDITRRGDELKFGH